LWSHKLEIGNQCAGMPDLLKILYPSDKFPALRPPASDF